MTTIQARKQNGVGWITFHRPQVRNAVNTQMMRELELQLDRWQDDDQIRVIVFMGDSRTFVSGGDLEEFHKLTTKEEVFPVMNRMGRLLNRVRHLKKPTVAAVEGTAVGGGCEIVASCDFRLASDQAVFGFIQSRLGITSGWGGGSLLLEEIPRGHALFLLLSGEKVSARQLEQWGWIHRVFPHQEFKEKVEQFVAAIACASPAVSQSYLELDKVRRRGANREALQEMESRLCSELWETEEHKGAVDRFLKGSRE